MLWFEAWDETAEFLVSNEAKERELEKKSEILGMSASSSVVRVG